MTSNYVQQIEAWRTEVEEQLRAPGPWGWLAVVGMHPLKIGKNAIGSAPQCDILLPAGSAPEWLGTIEFDGQVCKLRVNVRENVMVDGVEVRVAALRHDYHPDGMSVVRVRNISFGIIQGAAEPHKVCVWDADNPLRFDSLGRVWFPVDSAWRTTGQFIPNRSAFALLEREPPSRLREFMHLGNVHFEFRQQRYVFAAMRSELGYKTLKLLVRDFTNKHTTFERGRILYATKVEEGLVELDFNRLLHPPGVFCRYVEAPVPPITNVLMMKVEAGERLP